MKNLDLIVSALEEMKSDSVRNYVIAGLDSHLLQNGKVRLFECSRWHQDQITPHSHRFDFACLVLEGYVQNRIWERTSPSKGDLFQCSELSYEGEIGNYAIKRNDQAHFLSTPEIYNEGECYGMKASEIHSIEFSKGAKVLFFEGPTVSNKSIVLEPVVNGEIIPTFEKRDYMFKKDPKGVSQR